MLPLFLDECNHCGAIEERVFTDSWSGKELCLQCLHAVAYHVTNSPCSEGDNLIDELNARAPWGESYSDDEEWSSYGGNESPDPQHSFV